jgi:thioredoxin 1
MRKPILTLLIAAVVVAAGAGSFALWNSSAPSETTAAEASGALQEYTPEAVASASPGDTVVLFFHATWCPTCKQLADDIRANADDVPDDVRILLVDYDTATELKQKYGVTLQHTLVQVNSDGDPLGTWHLTRTLDELLNDLD